MTVKISFAYKQGFRRLWIVLSVLWLALIGYARWFNQGGDHSEFASSFLQLGIIPVAILYLFGVICVWLIEGFARADR